MARRRGILREGVADERQKRVEGTRPAHAAAEAARLMLEGSAHRLMVDAEGHGDGPDLPMLAEIEAPNLGALCGRDPSPLLWSTRGHRAGISHLLTRPQTRTARRIGGGRR